MDEINWFDVIPSAMSAIAAIGSAAAAFLSLRVTKSLAKQSVLASHHASAAVALSEAVKLLKTDTQEFSEFIRDLLIDWPREIEKRDNYYAGGRDSRPLRHVLSNACEMLVNHGKQQGHGYLGVQWSMFSIVRDGVTNLNDDEYKRLLARADSTYGDFEGIFGAPSPKIKISDSPAFRWICYQLTKRASEKDWREIWEGAWQEGGWLTQFRYLHSQVKPTFEDILASLKLEKLKLAHTVLPLESNPSLCKKYEDVMHVVEMLLEDGGLDSLDRYKKWPHSEDLSQLVVYSLGIAYLVEDALESIDANS